MKIGISTASFLNRMNPETVFEVFKQLRLEVIDTLLTCPSEYEPKFLDSLAPRKGSMLVHSVQPMGHQFEPELFSPNARVRYDAEVIFKKVCYCCRMLGAKFYTFLGPVKLDKINSEHDIDKLCDRMNQLSAIAKNYGIVLSYENSHYSHGNNPEFFKRLYTQCPAVGMTLDMRHSLISNIDPIKFLDVMKGRLSTIYLCDVSKELNTVMPGEGKYNFEKFFAEIFKRRLNCNMFVKVSSSDFKDLNQLKNCYDYLNAMWIKVSN